LRYGLDYSRQKGAEQITLEVRRSNYKAIALYRSFHFQPQGIRRRYYSDSGEDAVIMILYLDDAAPPASP
jgi:ribosomal-protein-alanine N-acetyltransferase